MLGDRKIRRNQRDRPLRIGDAALLRLRDDDDDVKAEAGRVRVVKS